jgi:hypothetical protein
MTVVQVPNGAGRQHSLAADLLDEINSHLAWQADPSDHRLEGKASVGTLIVDWDGTGTPIISYGNYPVIHVTRPVEVEMEPEVLQASIQPRQRVPRERSLFQPLPHTQYVSPSAPLLTHKGKQRADSAYASVAAPEPTFSPRVRPLRTSSRASHAPPNYKSSRTSSYTIVPPSLRPRRTVDIDMHARQNIAHRMSSHSAYDYNDHMVRGQRDAPQQRKYAAMPPVQYVTHLPAAAPVAPPRPSGKFDKVGSFVKQLLGRLEATGIMGKFRKQRAVARRDGGVCDLKLR